MIPGVPWGSTTEEQRLACYRFLACRKQAKHVNDSSRTLGAGATEEQRLVRYRLFCA